MINAFHYLLERENVRNCLYSVVLAVVSSPSYTGKYIPVWNGLSHSGNMYVLCSQEEDRADNAGKSLSGSLFTSEGLQASYRDLEQIFDNSDASSDETVSILCRDVYCLNNVWYKVAKLWKKLSTLIHLMSINPESKLIQNGSQTLQSLGDIRLGC